MKCSICNKDKDVRPYEPDGSFICYDCSMSTSDIGKTVEQIFMLQLNTAIDQVKSVYNYAIMLGTEVCHFVPAKDKNH